MKYQIRKGIWETSSSSATSVAMLSPIGKTDIPVLTKPFKLIQGMYRTDGDGSPHCYLNTWMDKMAYLAKDTKEWHSMFKEATGKDFEMWVFVPNNEETKNKLRLENINFETLVCEEDDSALREPEWGYICNWQPLEDEYIIIRSRDLSLCMNKCHIYPYAESYHDWFCVKDIISDEECDKNLIKELIFNTAFAINIGGDAYCNDTQTVPEIGSREDTMPLRRRPFAIFRNYYVNGTERLLIGSDGTKVRIANKNSVPEYPESIDMKITDYCFHECPFCYENCTVEGKNGEKAKFLEKLPEFVELALGGGNVLFHPNYPDFLNLTKYVNMTIHSSDFLESFRNIEFPHEETYPDIITCRALGISVSDEEGANDVLEIYNREDWLDRYTNSYLGFVPSDVYKDSEEDYKSVETVIHVVNGVITESVLKLLYDKNLKLLVLGYKTKGRGVEYANNPSVAENQKWLYDNIEEVAKHFKVVAFDTLALKQLDMKRFLTDEDWETMYMGDDGLHSMYVDLVKGEYGISSTDDRRWPLTDDIRDMFKHVREVVLSEKADTKPKGD